jgi:dTDP-4-dehydrorhamnose 3,5-epimerase
MQPPIPLPLSGAFLINQFAATDARGQFVKTFNHKAFVKAGLPEFTIRESYYSVSARNVVRGMHFQLPPFPLAKIVFCPVGAILDVILDLRRSSPTYGQHCAIELSAANRQAIFLPEGFAHGFRALEDNTITYYLVSNEYHRETDTGIHVSTIGFGWGISEMNLSDRDKTFVALSEFQTPFE